MTILKMFWADLDALFLIVVPGDLWSECKVAVAWSTEEPASVEPNNAPSEWLLLSTEQS